jgi:hypothetical protein
MLYIYKIWNFEQRRNMLFRRAEAGELRDVHLGFLASSASSKGSAGRNIVLTV